MGAEATDYFTGRIANDTFDLIAGERLGRGLSRDVWSCGLDDRWVLKFQVGTGTFQNIHEWQVWQEVQHWDFGRKWFAPCKFISSTGLVLVQERTSPVPYDYKWPEKVPHWFTDLKKSNFGMLDGRLVCHDYGLTLALSQGMNKRLRKAEWYD